MAKKFSDKVKVVVSPRQGNGEVPSDDALRDALSRADWTDDPGVGKAVLLPDGSELVSPLPHALPLGYVVEKSMMEIIDERIRAHRALLDARDEIDSREDMNDFEVAEEPDIFTLYEFEVMMEDFPGKGDPPAKPAEISEKKEEVIPVSGDKSPNVSEGDGTAG